jgi:hypothetical protein
MKRQIKISKNGKIANVSRRHLAMVTGGGMPLGDPPPKEPPDPGLLPR